MSRRSVDVEKKVSPHGWGAHLCRLEESRAKAVAVTPEAIKHAQQRGRLPCRVRIERLLDPGTFEEVGSLVNSALPGLDAPADGLVCGYGEIDGRRVCVAADDGFVTGGARGISAERKLARLRRQAAGAGFPFIWLQEGSGARIQEQMGAVFAGAFADPLIDQVRLMSGNIPTVAVLFGNCFGQPAFVAALADFVVMTPTAFAGVAGPPVVTAATGEEVSPEDLGGHELHARQTGLVHHIAEDEDRALLTVRTYLSYFPSSRGKPPPVSKTREAGSDQEELLKLVPTNLMRAYDVRKVIATLADAGSVFEVRDRYGRGVVTALIRIEGQPAAIIASQPMFKAGVLEPDTAEKIADFIELADAFRLPLIFLQDVPGFLVGTQMERAGQIARATRAIAALARSTTPKFTVILRKAYGLAYMVMCGRPMGPDSIVAWPTASISQMGPGPGVEVIYRRQIAEAEDPAATRAELARQFEDLLDPYIAARQGYLDDIIDPRETRRHLAGCLRRAHGEQL